MKKSSELILSPLSFLLHCVGNYYSAKTNWTGMTYLKIYEGRLDI